MLTDNLKNKIDFVILYAADETVDWFRIKIELINCFSPKERKNFSRRHFSTKKHILNKFDKEVIEYWEEKTGKKLWINPEKLHPEDWVKKPKGWGLAEINEKRKQDKRKRESG